MAKRLQLRRGTTAEHSSFTGAVGEVTVDTTKDTLVVHDGALAGGVAMAKEADVYTQAANDVLLDAKADLAGSATQAFKVADAVNSDDAINLGQALNFFTSDLEVRRAIAASNPPLGYYELLNKINNGDDVSLANVSQITDMFAMFEYSDFNQDISAWDVSSVTDMDYMFSMSEFNQDISAWDVSSVTQCSGFRDYSSLTCANTPALDASCTGC